MAKCVVCDLEAEGWLGDADRVGIPVCNDCWDEAQGDLTAWMKVHRPDLLAESRSREVNGVIDN